MPPRPPRETRMDALASSHVSQWNSDQKENALDYLAELIASTIESGALSANDVKTVLNDKTSRDDETVEAWRDALADAELESARRDLASFSVGTSSVHACAGDSSLPTRKWQCEACGADQDVVDVTRLIRGREARRHVGVQVSSSCTNCGYKV